MNLSLIPALGGAAAGIGIALMIAGLIRTPQRAPGAADRPTGPITKFVRNFRALDDQAKALRATTAVIAVAAGAGAWLLTQVPVIGLGITAVVLLLPQLLMPNAAIRRHTERQQALADWTR